MRIHPVLIGASVMAGAVVACSSLSGQIAPTAPVDATVQVAPPTPSPLPPTPTPLPRTNTLYMCYGCSGDQIWELKDGQARQITLPIRLGSFFGYDSGSDRILYAGAFPTHGEGPTPVSVSDLSILNVTTGATTRLFDDNIVEAHWTPDGQAIAYILATPKTYELHWRRLDGTDRLLASDVAFTWAVAPSSSAIAFTRESRYKLQVDPGLYVVSIDTGKEVKVADVDKAGFGGTADQPYWSPDSRQIAFPVFNGPDVSRLVLANADGSSSVDLKIDPALSSNSWATPGMAPILWHPDDIHWLVQSAASQGELGGPSPLVAYRLNQTAGLLTEGRFLGEIGALIDWDEPGRSVWVTSLEGQVKRIVLDPLGS